MARVKRGTRKRQRRKKILKRAKGYYGAKSKLYKSAKEAVERSLKFAYAHRRKRKRDFRSLWIVRINAAARLNDLSYSKFINGLKKADIKINRKMLADLAVNDPGAFGGIAEAAREALKGS